MKTVFRRLCDPCTWENFLRIFGFVEALPSASLNVKPLRKNNTKIEKAWCRLVIWKQLFLEKTLAMRLAVMGMVK